MVDCILLVIHVESVFQPMNLYVFNADESSLDPEYADSFSWLKKKDFL